MDDKQSHIMHLVQQAVDKEIVRLGLEGRPDDNGAYNTKARHEMNLLHEFRKSFLKIRNKNNGYDDLEA